MFKVILPPQNNEFEYWRSGQEYDIKINPDTGTLYHLEDSDDAIRQNIMTRLNTKRPEWWLNNELGVGYSEIITGKIINNDDGLTVFDSEIKRVILETEGVKDLVSFESSFFPLERRYVCNYEYTRVDQNELLSGGIDINV